MDLQAMFSQILELTKRLTKQQKIIIISSIVAVIALIALLVVLNISSGKKGDDGYRVLFDNLSPQDAALVVQQLEKDKIDYRLPREGVIEVPEAVVEKERLAVASLGIPKESKVGFELFDKQEFGATDFDKNVKYLRALEGELARTIKSLSVIEDATVHIALPKESVFVSQETPPTASIVVKMKPNMVLMPKQVVGIKNLVAAAVPKLTSENVKIVNENGEPLGDDDETIAAGELAKQQLKYKKEYEKAYEEKIVKVLAPIVGGEDRVVARVTIDFDFSQKTAQSETFDPNSVVRSEQTLEEKREGPVQQQVGGVPGAVSNIGPVQGIEGNTAGEKYSKNQTTTNYEISKTISNVKSEFATIKRVTAAVVVDGKYEFKKEADGTPTEEVEYKPLERTELEQITALVRQSIGFSQQRGDEVSVSNFRFQAALGEGVKPTGIALFTAKAQSVLGPVLPYVKYLIAAVLLFIFYKKVIEPLPSKIAEIPIEEETIRPREIIFDEDELGEDENAKLKEMKKKLEEQLGITSGTSEESIKYEVLLEKVRNILEERTDEMAHLMMTLIRDEIESQGNKPKES
ncbi:MAG: flagellar M-ring protein FliF [Campylobacterales bacterium]